MEIDTKQKYKYVIWKNCPHFTPEKNRRFRLGRISEGQHARYADGFEVFDAKYRKWVRASGNYIPARAAKLKEILEAA